MKSFNEVVAMGILMALVFGVAVLWDSYSCSEVSEMMALEERYSVTTGCMVRKNNRWIPLGAIREVD